MNLRCVLCRPIVDSFSRVIHYFSPDLVEIKASDLIGITIFSFFRREVHNSFVNHIRKVQTAASPDTVRTHDHIQSEIKRILIECRFNGMITKRVENDTVHCNQQPDSQHSIERNENLGKLYEVQICSVILFFGFSALNCCSEQYKYASDAPKDYLDRDEKNETRNERFADQFEPSSEKLHHA